jgi:hypothetical protein
VLYHLCTSSIRDGMIAVGASTRYRQKVRRAFFLCSFCCSFVFFYLVLDDCVLQACGSAAAGGRLGPAFFLFLDRARCDPVVALYCIACVPSVFFAAAVVVLPRTMVGCYFFNLPAECLLSSFLQSFFPSLSVSQSKSTHRDRAGLWT